MAQRLEFHKQLVEALGSRNVYFQPPESVQLTYPCIVYERSRADSKFGDNTNWMYTPRYSVTLISRNPDEPVLDVLADMPMSTFERHFVSHNLHHDVFNIYQGV